MSANHAGAGNYRAKALADNGTTCYLCGKVCTPEEVEADHVRELADGGSKGRHNISVACKVCHRKKSAAARVARAKTAKAKERLAPVQAPRRWVLSVLLIAAVGSGEVWWFGPRALWRVPLLVAVVAVVLGWRWQNQRARRRDLAGALRDGLCKATQVSTVAPGALRIRQWHGLSPVVGSHTYLTAPDFNDWEPTARAAVEMVVRVRVHDDLTFAWDHTRYVVRWRPARPGEERVVPVADVDRDQAQARLKEAVGGFVRGPVTVTVGWDAVGPESIEVRYPTTFRDDDAGVRYGLQARISEKTGLRWRFVYHGAEDRLVATRRPPMPALVAHPPPVDVNPKHLELGVSEDATAVVWDFKKNPHLLVVGSTGAGKTVVMCTIATRALASDCDVVIVDGKGTSLAGLRDWPGVLRTGFADPEQMSEALCWLEALCNQRYGLIRDHDAEPGDFRRIVLIFDEAADAIQAMNGWWKGGAKKAAKSDITTAPGMDAWKTIARKGREARINLVLGIQQAAAGFFDGSESRDQLGGRIACGPLSEQGAQMTFARTDVGRDLPEIPGRATVRLGGKIEEAQLFWTPAPKPSGTIRHEDAAILRPLLDRATSLRGPSLPVRSPRVALEK